MKESDHALHVATRTTILLAASRSFEVANDFYTLPGGAGTGTPQRYGQVLSTYFSTPSLSPALGLRGLPLILIANPNPSCNLPLTIYLARGSGSGGRRT